MTSKRLDAALSEHAAKVFAKVRVADILPIEGSGVTSEDYRFALQAHFDFLVSDGEHHPLFAVEVDGPQHATPEQAARDGRKDSLCERFDFPILRINANWLKEQYRGFSLLAWFVLRDDAWPRPVFPTHALGGSLLSCQEPLVSG